MEKIYNTHLFVLSFFICLFVGSCKQNLVAPQPQIGDLDLSNFVAIGDGFSAGFKNTDINNPKSNIGLFESGQLNSFPLLLVNQFNQATFVAEFKTSFLSENGSGFFELEEVQVPICEDSDIQPVLVKNDPNPIWAFPAEDKQVNNLSIPQLAISQVEVPNLQNTFLNRLKSDSSSSYLDLLKERAPSFFTIYLGSRDILNYAMRGGADPEYPLLPSAEFGNYYAKVLRTIFNANPNTTRGVVGKIPDISEFPFFTNIGNLWKNSNNCNSGTRSLYVQTQDGSIRTARETDRILLSASDRIGEDTGTGNEFGLTYGNPIPADLVLDNDEVRELKLRISEYNIIIDSLVADVNQTYSEKRVVIAKVDVLVQGLTIGLIEDGLDINNQYLSGGFFALDGLYLTPRGNALIANEFIKAINDNDDFGGASISPVNVINYSGVNFP